MAQSVNLTTGTTVFALHVVQEDWGGEEEEDRGDMLEFGGHVAGQVVRLVKHYLGSTFGSYRIISLTDPELATLTLSSLLT